MYNQLSGYSGNAGDSLSQLVGNAWTSEVKDIFHPADCPTDDRFTGKCPQKKDLTIIRDGSEFLKTGNFGFVSHRSDPNDFGYVFPLVLERKTSKTVKKVKNQICR